MSDKEIFVDSARLLGKSYSFTIPKSVREIIDTKVKYRVLSFFEEEEGKVSIGYKSNNFVLSSSEFYSSYQITITKNVREILGIGKNDFIGFYRKQNLVFIKKM